MSEIDDRFENWWKKKHDWICYPIAQKVAAKAAWVYWEEKNQKQSWIKVTDKLPKDGEEVLCLWSWGSRDGLGRGINVCYQCDGEWVGAADYAGYVTHWMPTPETLLIV